MKSLIEEDNLRTAPLVKMYLMCSQYTPDKVINYAGGPSHAAFLDPGNISSFADVDACVALRAGKARFCLL